MDDMVVDIVMRAIRASVSVIMRSANVIAVAAATHIIRMVIDIVLFAMIIASMLIITCNASMVVAAVIHVVSMVIDVVMCVIIASMPIVRQVSVVRLLEHMRSDASRHGLGKTGAVPGARAAKVLMSAAPVFLCPRPSIDPVLQPCIAVVHPLHLDVLGLVDGLVANHCLGGHGHFHANHSSRVSHMDRHWNGVILWRACYWHWHQTLLMDNPLHDVQRPRGRHSDHLRWVLNRLVDHMPHHTWWWGWDWNPYR